MGAPSPWVEATIPAAPAPAPPMPIGVFGTVWAYLKLEERSTPKRARVDWWGNLTFALGLILIMVSVTYGIRPYGGHATGWTSPKVIALLGAGMAITLG